MIRLILTSIFLYFILAILFSTQAQAGYWFRFVAEDGDAPVATWLDEEVRMSIIDGSAFIWIPGRDLSAYAGTDGSSTPYRIVIKDDSGDELTGYLGSQGSGETLEGTNLFTNGDFASGDLTGWDDSGSAMSVVSNEAVHSVAITTTLKQDFNSYKKLMKMSFDLVSITSGLGPKLQICGTSGNYDSAIGIHTAYGTHHVDYNQASGVFIWSTALNATFDDFDIQQVTEGPTVYSLHVVSTDDGSTRNWTSLDETFNMHQAFDNEYGVYIYEN